MSDHLVVMEGGTQAYNDKYTYSAVKDYFPSMAEEAVETAQEAGKKTPNVPHAMSEQQGLLVTSQRPKQSKILRPQASMPVPVETPKTPPVPEVKENIYRWYITTVGSSLFAIATLIFMVGQLVRVYSDVWVSVWTQRKYSDEGFDSDAFYAGIYAMLVTVFLCLSFTRAFYYYYVGRVGASKLHDLTFGAALKAPMHFFHVTPIGKLLSFFSKDIDTIDDVLVDNMLMFQILFWILIYALGVVSYNLPLFLAIVAGLGVVYVYIVHVFIRTSAPLKKAVAKSTSDVVAHTAETLSGLAVVRAFRMQEKFLDENLKYQARSTVVTFSIANLSLWLAFRVDIIGSLLVLACCLLAVLDESMSPSTAGLIVSNSFQILLFFSIMSRFMGEVHDNMTAVENARTMSELEEEQEPIVEVEVPAKWPSKGEIKFEDVVMSYLPGKPPVLKGISFSVREGEKIGVVGRTGAGKCEYPLSASCLAFPVTHPTFSVTCVLYSLSHCGIVPIGRNCRRQD